MSGSSRTLTLLLLLRLLCAQAAFICERLRRFACNPRREGRRLIRPRYDRFVVRPRRQDRNVRRLDVRLAEEGASLPDDRPPRSPRQKPGVDEGIDDKAAIVHPERPESDCLWQRQLHLGHLHEIQAHTIHDGCEAHGRGVEQRPRQPGVPRVRRGFELLFRYVGGSLGPRLDPLNSTTV